MSDVSKINELVTEARSGKYLTPGERYELIDRLADALEAATRVPVLGEPNDDREALARLLPEVANGWLDEPTDFERYPEYFLGEADRILEAGFSRATVPDAATVQARADSEWRDGTVIAELAEAETERDTALDAVERVRASVEKHKHRHWSAGCGWDVSAIKVLAALDGAPEPEVKP